MHDEHRHALRASLDNLCKDLDAEGVLPYLLADGVIQDEQAQEIMAISRKSTRNMQLVTIIKAAGPLAFQKFINILQICNKEYLAEAILAHLPPSSTQQQLPEPISIQSESRELTLNAIDSDGRAPPSQVKMRVVYQNVIEKYWVRLVSLDFPITLRIANYLLSQNVIDQQAYEKIENVAYNSGSTAANQFMLRHLKTLADSAFDGLINALGQVDHLKSLADDMLNDIVASASSPDNQSIASQSTLTSQFSIQADTNHERMRKKSKAALVKNLNIACEKITERALENIVAIMISKRHLLIIDAQQINKEALLSSKTRALFEILSTRTETAFLDFLDALDHVRLQWLANQIRQQANQDGTTLACQIEQVGPAPRIVINLSAENLQYSLPYEQMTFSERYEQEQSQSLSGTLSHKHCCSHLDKIKRCCCIPRLRAAYAVIVFLTCYVASLYTGANITLCKNDFIPWFIISSCIWNAIIFIVLLVTYKNFTRTYKVALGSLLLGDLALLITSGFFGVNGWPFLITTEGCGSLMVVLFYLSLFIITFIVVLANFYFYYHVFLRCMKRRDQKLRCCAPCRTF